MKLAELAGYHRNKPVIKERHDAFVREERPFTAASIAFATSQMAKADRDRRGSFSASSLGSCLRQQQFTYLGLRQLPQSAQRQGVLLNGDFAHLRLQMVGLSEGYLAEAEVPIGDNYLGLKGTMDGVSADGDVVEYKSINDRGYRMLTQANEPKEDHVFQVGTYMYAAGLSRAVIFYENKNNQDTKEYVVELTDELMDKVGDRAVLLGQLTEGKNIAEMLEPCKEGKGWQMDYCPFKDRCPAIKTWKQAQALGLAGA